MFKRPITISACLAILMLAPTAGLLAQSIPSPDRQQDSANWKPPVRLVPRPAAPSGLAPSDIVTQAQYVDSSQAFGASPREHLATPEGSTAVAHGGHAPIMLGPSAPGPIAAGPIAAGPIAAGPIAAGQGQLPVMTLPSQPLHAHEIIRAPRIVHSGGRQAKHSSGSPPVSRNGIHPPLHVMHHHAAQESPAVIPDASHREVWKSPFSYGYFGSRGSRQWTRHFGYRDRDTEWRLR